ncbi:MAG: sulfotransferase [Rhizomicrobium sp.]
MPETLASLMARAADAAATGDLVGAEALFARATARAPNNAGVWGSLACLRNLVGQPAGALVAADTALALIPDDAVLLVQRGDALSALHRAGEALAAFTAAIKKSPGSVPAGFGRGRALLALGQPDKALEAFRAVQSLQPGNITLRFAVAELLFVLNRLVDAAAELAGLYGAHPGAVTLGLQIGAALGRDGAAEAALGVFDRIRQAVPGCAEAAFSAGCTLRSLGRIAAAEAALDHAVQLDGRPLYHRILAGVKRFTPDDPGLTVLEDMARREEALAPAARVDLHFALAKAYEDLGRPADVFAALNRGNTLKRAMVSYDEAAQLGALAEIAARYGAEAFTRPPSGPASTAPVFVFGMPRTGSTLVEQMLASHPDVCGAGEVRILRDAVRGVCGDTGLAAPLVTDDQAAAIGAAYAGALTAKFPAARRVVDKMPGNFLYAGLMARALPQARLIHIHRNAQDCCFSCYATLFAAGHRYAYDLAELGRYFRAYEQLMAHWRVVLPPGQMLDVPYEALVQDFPVWARRIIAFCDLEWDARCLDFFHTPRAVITASAVQVRQPVYTGAIGRAAAYAPWLSPLTAALAGR